MCGLHSPVIIRAREEMLMNVSPLGLGGWDVRCARPRSVLMWIWQWGKQLGSALIFAIVFVKTCNMTIMMRTSNMAKLIFEEMNNDEKTAQLILFANTICFHLINLGYGKNRVFVTVITFLLALRETKERKKTSGRRVNVSTTNNVETNGNAAENRSKQ